MNQNSLSQLSSTIQELNNSLSLLKPDNSESEAKETFYKVDQTTQLITYALIATAVVGIFIYHYIKSQESLD